MFPAFRRFIAENYNRLLEPEENEVDVQRVLINENYEPSIADVLVIKLMLAKALQLPIEIVESILDAAEYWPHTTTFKDYTRTGDGYVKATGGPHLREDLFLVRCIPVGFSSCPVNLLKDYTVSPPIPQCVKHEYDVETFQKLTESPTPLLEYPCRKIIFTIRSHDQGWVDQPQPEEQYQGSWTWFEAGLERFDSDMPASYITGSELGMTNLHTVQPTTTINQAGGQVFHHPVGPDLAMKVQANVVAEMDATEHRIEWRWTDDIDPESPEGQQLHQIGRGTASANGEFVRNLKLGDVVTLWAKARFPSWTNMIEQVRIEVFWAV